MTTQHRNLGADGELSRIIAGAIPVKMLPFSLAFEFGKELLSMLFIYDSFLCQATKHSQVFMISVIKLFKIFLAQTSDQMCTKIKYKYNICAVLLVLGISQHLQCVCYM